MSDRHELNDLDKAITELSYGSGISITVSLALACIARRLEALEAKPEPEEPSGSCSYSELL